LVAVVTNISYESKIRTPQGESHQDPAYRAVVSGLGVQSGRMEVV